MIREKAERFIWENARLLERAIFEYRFYDGSPERIVNILRTYQNADGGFGQALEPDLRAPDSQPLFVEFALRTLYECDIHDAELAYSACNFLAMHTDPRGGIPAIFASASRYPRADHWNNPAAEQPSLDRLSGLVGLALWQGIQHPWLEQVVPACLDYTANVQFNDAHTILTAFCLIESLAQKRDMEILFEKLTNELLKARFYCAEVPVKDYGLTPLSFAPRPDAFCRRMFTQVQIEEHLSDMEAKQEEDGGWPIQWKPPGEQSKWEWRAYKTVNAMCILRAYGRI